MNARAAAVSLMVGNFVVGASVLAPAGMLNELAADVAGTISAAGLLMTYGAAVLCVGSPVMSWITSRMDRRVLLAGVLLVLAVGHIVSAMAPDYATVLAVRLVMVAAAAPFTPQAASTIALLVSERQRASAISFVFLGWSLSVAAGLPLIKLVATHLGWRASFGVLAGAALLGFGLLLVSLPAGLRGVAVSARSWAAIARHRRICLILLVTAVQVAGQFGVFTYLAPLLVKLADAGPKTIGAFFALFGAAGFVGNLIATRIVIALGALRTTILYFLSALVGVALWSFGAGTIPVMAVGMAVWGLGFGAVNSMQQARLVAAEPSLAAGSVALNTSAIYVGQAIGSALGGFLLVHGLPLTLSYVAAVSLTLSLILLVFTRGPGEAL